MLEVVRRTLAASGTKDDHGRQKCGAALVAAVRNLNLHEYQSMEIMKSFNVAIPAGEVRSPIISNRDIQTGLIAILFVAACVLA